MIDEIYSNILENIDIGVFVLNREGTVIYVNSMASRLLGRSKTRLLNLNTYQAYEEGLIDYHIFNQVLTSKKPVTCFQAYTEENATESFSLLVTQTPVLDQNSEVKYSIGTFLDMDYLYHKVNFAKRKQVQKFIMPDSEDETTNNFIYASMAMRQLVKMVDQVANSDATIMIKGESGTGKEIMAQYIHSQSDRREKEMIVVNCAALPENLLESELFGYEKGAFTGALKDGKPGLVELADHGTLFLDEIDSLPIALQGKLLRVLESHEVRRIGGVSSKQVDFRLLAATNADLNALIRRKEFRADLFYRINVVPVTIPPLRERKEDIPLLCEVFFKRYEHKYGWRKSFSAKAYNTLMDYEWPGNVRELKNFVERIILLTDVTISEIDSISPDLLKNPSEDMPVAYAKCCQNNTAHFESVFEEGTSLKEAVRKYEQWLIEQAVHCYGSNTKAAKSLGIDRTTLIRKIKE